MIDKTLICEEPSDLLAFLN